MASVILIHGASSAGKSTLARAVHGSAPTPFLRLTFDQLIDSGALPSTGWREVRSKVMTGYHRAMAAYAGAGCDLVVDHILEGAAEAELRDLLAGEDLFFVALHCPLEELRRREQARGNRREGEAEADFLRVHKGLRYDLELQSLDGIEANAARLWLAWAQRGPRSAFFG